MLHRGSNRILSLSLNLTPLIPLSKQVQLLNREILCLERGKSNKRGLRPLLQVLPLSRGQAFLTKR
jgi:hypothetical protein